MTTFYSDEIDSSANTERSTTAVVHRYSDSGVAATAISSSVFGARCKTANSGALTAGVLSSALVNISGTAGVLTDCSLHTVDATARTLRIKIVADGVTVFDSTTASVSASGSGFWACCNGSYDNTSAVANTPSIVFNSTLTIQVASSLTETDKVRLSYAYSTRA